DPSTHVIYTLSLHDALPIFLPDDPFQVLDQEGVGRLMELAVRLGRGVRPELKVGICGEHGGEPSSVKFCHRVGMNYVSCSPFRVDRKSTRLNSSHDQISYAV